jgi:hypothetical protein
MTTLLCTLIGLATSSAIALLGARLLTPQKLVPVRVKAHRQPRR